MGDISEYFDRSEFACGCGCGRDDISMDLVHVLGYVRTVTERPIKINSGVRCDKHNLAVGGVIGSAHTKGEAADLECKESDYRYNLIRVLIDAGVKRIGIGKTFIHVDIDETKPYRVIWLY